MSLIEWPNTPDQLKLAYNLLIVGGLVGVVYLWAARGIWQPFLVVSIFTILWVWDIFVRPSLRPETEVSDENFMDVQFSRWLSGNQDKYEQRLGLSEKRSQSLSEEVKALREELDKLRRS